MRLVEFAVLAELFVGVRAILGDGVSRCQRAVETEAILRLCGTGECGGAQNGRSQSGFRELSHQFLRDVRRLRRRK